MTDPVLVRGERPRPAVVRQHPHAGWFAVATVCFGAFMGQLDASIVTLAFPALQRVFGLPLAAVEWVSLAYLLTLILLTWMTVILTCDDWNHRVFLSISPYVILLATGFFKRVFPS